MRVLVIPSATIAWNFSATTLAAGYARTCLLVGTVAATDLNPHTTRVGLGGGVTIPAGDYGSADKTGWHVLGAALVPVPTPQLAIRFDDRYSHTSHQGFASGHTTLGGGVANAVWRLRREGPTLRRYLLLGLGFFDVSGSTAGAELAAGARGTCPDCGAEQQLDLAPRWRAPQPVTCRQ